MQFYQDLKRKISGTDTAAATTTISHLIEQIMLLLSTTKRLRKSHFHPIHCAFLRWISLNHHHHHHQAITNHETIMENGLDTNNILLDQHSNI